MNFCYIDESRESPILMYAIPLNVLAENLIGDAFRVSEMDLLTSMAINEGVSGSLKSHYGLVYHNDCLAWGNGFIIKNARGEYKRRNVFFRKV